MSWLSAKVTAPGVSYTIKSLTWSSYEHLTLRAMHNRGKCEIPYEEGKCITEVKQSVMRKNSRNRRKINDLLFNIWSDIEH